MKVLGFVIILAAIGVATAQSEFPTELNNIPFDSIIGGPLTAAIEAQAASAAQTIQFIKDVGFKNGAGVVQGTGEEDLGDVNMVEFSYEFQNTSGTTVTKKMKVPFLTIVPIPFIRVDELTVELNVKLNSVERTSSSFGIETSASVSGRCFFCGFSFSVSASLKYSTSTQTEVTRNYSMRVYVRATQPEIPAGMDRMITLLESIIKDQKTS